MALFELLLHHQGLSPFELHIAHVDHGWRQESAQEAEFLKDLAEKRHCPFHLRRLRGAADRDIENTAREQRLAFFEEVVRETGAEALCLAHHSDDLVETVLKRLFESAPLERVGAFGFESRVNGLVIWRPLIHLSKQEISSYGFDDATNRDRRFLRARLRHDLLPEIEQHFGKGVRGALQRLSKRSHRLDSYLEKQCAPWLGDKRIPLGIDFTGADTVEIEYVLSRRADLPANLRETIAERLASMQRHCLFELGSKKVVVHGGAILITESLELNCEDGGSLSPASSLASPWYQLWTEGGSWPIGSGELVFGDKRYYSKPHFKAIPAPLRPYLPASPGPLSRCCTVEPVDFRAKIV